MNLHRYLILPVLAVLFLTSCKKDKEETKPTGTSTPDFLGIKAEIDNKSWQSLTSTGLLDSLSFSISGTTADGSTLTIVFDSTRVGKYPVDGVSASFAYYVDSTKVPVRTFDTEVSSQYRGYVEITSIDMTTKLVSGKFSFALRNQATSALISADYGEFRNVQFRILKEEADTAKSNNSSFIGNVDLHKKDTTLSNYYEISKGKTRLMGSRVITEYKLDAITTLRMELEQRLVEGQILYPTKNNNLDGAFQIIRNGVVFQNDSGMVEILHYDTDKKEMSGTFNIKYLKNPADSSYYTSIGDFHFIHP